MARLRHPEPTRADPVEGPGTPMAGPRPVDPAGTPTGPTPAVPTERAERAEDRHAGVGRTRASTAYAGIIGALLVLVLIVIFILQNLSTASVHFFTADFRLPVGVVILIAAVAGGVLVLLGSAARVLQLRRAARRGPGGR